MSPLRPEDRRQYDEQGFPVFPGLFAPWDAGSLDIVEERAASSDRFVAACGELGLPPAFEPKWCAPVLAGLLGCNVFEAYRLEG